MPHSIPTLRNLAKARRLPAHQAMDQGTLDWITAHRPTALRTTADLPHETLMLVPERVCGQIESGLASGAAEYVRDRLSHLFAAVALDPAQDAAAFTFRRTGFASLTTAAPSLLGQTIFRDMRNLKRYPQLYLAFEQAKALEAWTYWNAQQIPTPFNGFLPKGEIGINTAYPGTCTTWVAEACERGLLHPIERLDVDLTPRLADLNMTAMRRDATGKAAGHHSPSCGNLG